MSTLLAAIIGAAVSLFKWIFGGKQQAAGVAQGRAEANAETAGQSAATEAAIAKAEADEPTTKDEALTRLESGTA